MHPNPAPNLVLVAEAARRSGLSVSTIRSDGACGVLEAGEIDGRAAVTERSLRHLLIALAKRRQAAELRRSEQPHRAKSTDRPKLKLIWTNPNASK